MAKDRETKASVNDQRSRDAGKTGKQPGKPAEQASPHEKKTGKK